MDTSTVPAIAADRRRRSALVVLCAAAVAVVVVSAVIDARVGADGRAANPLVFGAGSLTGASGLAVLAAAVVVVERSTATRVGVLLLAWGAFWAVGGLSESWVALSTAAGSTAPLASFALYVYERFTSLLPVGLAALLLLYPTGRILPGRWGLAGRASLTAMLLAVLWWCVRPEPAATGDALRPGLDRNPTTLPVDAGVADVVTTVVVTAAYLAAIVPLATVWWRHRQSRGTDRQRMRWLLWAAMVVVLMAVAIALLGDSLDIITGTITVLVPVAAVAIGLVHPTLGEIDTLLGSTLLYGALAIVVLGIDVLALTGLTALVGDALDQRTVVLVVLALSALVYAPLRSVGVGWVRRLVLGTRGDRYDVVAGLASSLERADDPAAQLDEIAAAVARAFRVPYVSVEVDRGRGERLVATHGERPAETRTLPVTYRDTEVGRLVLPAHGLRAHLSRRDEALLGDLVRQAAVAARTARLADELQESREQLVLAREEERRRIRRDLHDGLGPALSGVVFRLDSARMLVRQDPDASEAGLVVARDQVREVVADVRRLVHDLRPPALDDLGLVRALEQTAQSLSSPDLLVEVSSRAPDDLPAAVEVAAYRIAGEAMTNTVRHARASSCCVRLDVADGDLVVEVRDDGRGIEPGATTGVGLTSLRERAAELGGTSTVVCPPGGGTRVRATLPLRSRV